MRARERLEENVQTACTDLEELVYENASLVDHRDIQWAPVLEEGEVEKLVVDGEVVIGRGFIGGSGMGVSGTRSCANAWMIPGLCGETVQDEGVGGGLGKGGEVEPGGCK